MAAKESTDKQKKLDELQTQLASLQEEIGKFQGEGEKEKEVALLYSWNSPSRIHRKKSRRWAINLALMILIIVTILLFLKQFITIAAVLSLTFLVYVIDAVVPEDLEHQITTEGLTTAERSYLWEELYDFWFRDKGEYTMLHVSTHFNYPRQLLMLVKIEEKDKVKELLAKSLPFREHPHTSWIDNLSERLSAQFHHLVGS